jgi:hypothetical protein
MCLIFSPDKSKSFLVLTIFVGKATKALFTKKAALEKLVTNSWISSSN